MADRVVADRAPIGWDRSDDRHCRRVDLVHLHWPEWVAFDELEVHERAIARLADHDIPVVWTAHNLTPHQKDAAVYDPIYAAWAAAVDGVIHHSAWGEALMRQRYEFRPDCRHEVIPHGHFGGLWERAGLPDRLEAERRLGLQPTGLRIGIVGAPRREKLVQVVLDAVAACERQDVELVCWSLGPEEVVPDDPRIAIAERYRMVDEPVYATQLAACDVLALVFDPDGEMLATGSAADAIGLGLPALRSDWGYLVEQLGGAGIPVGHSSESIAAAIDGLTDEVLAEARDASVRRQQDLDWAPLATKTFDLFERVVLQEP
jgi:glycosyltransferase involved in cell wall biosynthesis